jgi:phosphatidate phosphatase LPIN
MREIVDHFFPPVGLLVPAGGEAYTDFNYWRDKPLDIEDFTDSEDEDSDDGSEPGSIHSEDERSEIGEDLEASYTSQASYDDPGMEDSVIESIENRNYEGDEYADEQDTDDEYDDDGETEAGITPTGEVRRDIHTPVQPMSSLDVRDSTPSRRASPRK